MTIRNATITILSALRDGIDPRDGSPLPAEHVCQAGEVVRALFDAVAVLEAAPGADDWAQDGASAGAASPAATRRPRRGRHGPVSADDETIEVGVAIEETAAGGGGNGSGPSDGGGSDGATAKSRRPRPANAGQPWREDDDRRLIELFDGGASLTEIATGFERTRGSIRARLVLLGRGDLVGPGPALRYPVGGRAAARADGSAGEPRAASAGGTGTSGDADRAAMPAGGAGSAGLVAEPFAPV